ncbi:MAG: hypothetical protein HYV96_03710 [Opitutae bacterium]|nr:hypothetical protein [Opitutae bacterium]
MLLPLASLAADAIGAAKDPSGAAQTHVLFTGADIRILYNGKVYPVEDVDGTSLAISVKDQANGLDVPRDYKNKKLVVNRTQYVTDRSITVTNFKHERAYTAAKDPYRKASEEIMNAVAMTTTVRRVEEQVRREPEKISPFHSGLPKRPGEEPQKVDNPFRQQLENQLRMAQSVSNSDFGDAGRIAGKMAEEQAKEEFDALKMECELSSPSPIKSAYVVVIAEYHTKESPKDSQLWLAAKSVGLIDSTPRKVWSREGGLPPGYILENVHLHVYERGTEFATNLSENQAALTRDEAHEYLVLDHTSTHKADTLPARIVLIKIPTDWATHPRDSSFLKTYYVKVDKTGRPTDAFEDETCETKVADSYYDAVLRDQLFLPALEKGQPVDSVVRMKLTKLSRAIDARSAD